MHLLQTLLEEVVSPRSQNRPLGRFWSRYPLHWMFATLLILLDNAFNLAEWGSAFTLWFFSILAAIYVVFPLGLIFERVAAKRSWSQACLTAIAAAAIFAVPTSAGSLVLGYWAWASLRAARQEQQDHDVIDVEVHEQPRCRALSTSTTNGRAIDRK